MDLSRYFRPLVLVLVNDHEKPSTKLRGPGIRLFFSVQLGNLNFELKLLFLWIEA